MIAYVDFELNEGGDDEGKRCQDASHRHFSQRPQKHSIIALHRVAPVEASGAPGAEFEGELEIWATRHPVDEKELIHSRRVDAAFPDEGVDSALEDGDEDEDQHRVEGLEMGTDLGEELEVVRANPHLVGQQSHTATQTSVHRDGLEDPAGALQWIQLECASVHYEATTNLLIVESPEDGNRQEHHAHPQEGLDVFQKLGLQAEAINCDHDLAFNSNSDETSEGFAISGPDCSRMFPLPPLRTRHPHLVLTPQVYPIHVRSCRPCKRCPRCTRDRPASAGPSARGRCLGCVPCWRGRARWFWRPCR